MAATAPMTKLEAVNEMLYDIGERPVSSLTSPSRLDVVRAVATLERVSKSVQSNGWWFNREELTLTPNGSGEYPIASDIIRVDRKDQGVEMRNPTGANRTYVVRGSVLYDTINQQSTGFTGDLTVLAVRLVDFEDLPATARDYIYAEASRLNLLRAIGATDLGRQLAEQAATALANLRSEDIDAEDYRSTQSMRHINLIHNR